MKKLACQAAAALAAAALLMTAPLGTVYASDTAAAASDVDFNALMAEVADSAGNAEDVQKAAEEAYNASMAIGNSAEISGIIASQTIVNLAFGRADSEEEIQNAAAAAQLLEQQSSAAAQRIASAAEAAAASADTAKSAAEEAAASAKETASAAASTEVSDSDRKLLAAIIYCEAGNQSMQGKIAVGNVEYFKGICEAAGLDAVTERDLRDALSGKNYFKVQDLLEDRNVAEIYRDQIMRITGHMRSEEDLALAMEKTSSERARAALQRLVDLDRLLADYGFENYVSYDLSLLSKYQYYTGILFKGYTYGVGEPIASGGRYDTLLAHFGKDAPSVGFMIPLDTMVEALRAQHIPIRVPEGPMVLSYTEQTFPGVLKKAQALRAEGKRVVMRREKTEEVR